MTGTSLRHILLLGVVAVTAAACGTSPITLAEARPGQRFAYSERSPNTAMVTVIRNAGLAGAACPTDITVDGRPAGSIWASQAVQLHIPAGEVILGASASCFGGVVEREARLVAGRSVTYRVGYDANGTMQFGRSVAP